MRLIPKACRVALRSYSMWANYLGLACLLAPEAIYLAAGVDTSPRAWWIAGVVLVFAGGIGRLIDQGGLDGDRSTFYSRWSVAVIAVTLLLGMGPYSDPAPEPSGGLPTVADFSAVAVPLIGRWEGLRTTAYLDTIADPPVWTVCYGETNGVGPGDTYTKAQCDAKLAAQILVYREGLHSYFTTQTRAARLTPERDAAYVSLAYNAGVSAIGRSTATRRINAGDIRGGCTALGWWNKAGGRVIRGLVNRRAEETALCLRGLA